MTEPENFLTRWSRRKRVAEEPAPPTAVEAAPQKSEADDKTAAGTAGKTVAPPAPAFDPASLPSLDSIGAETDISAFLKAGVPGDLRLAALRRAWATDPAIRDFKGLAENDWDFTVPNATMGFGEIDPGLDVKKMLTEVFGETPRADIASAAEPRPTGQFAPAAGEPATPSEHFALDPAIEAPSESEPSDPDSSARAGGNEMVQREKNIAVQDADGDTVDELVKRRRTQGGALPQ